MKKQINIKPKIISRSLELAINKLSEDFVDLRLVAEKRYREFENANSETEFYKIKAIPFSCYFNLVKSSKNVQAKILKKRNKEHLASLLLIQNMLITSIGYISIDKIDRNFLKKFKLMYNSLSENNEALYKLMKIPY